MTAEKLSERALQDALRELSPGWSIERSKLHHELSFKDFEEAFGFMTKMALYSEKRNHHPEWFNVYNRVTIDLTTHECEGISIRDIEWAKAADTAAV